METIPVLGGGERGGGAIWRGQICNQVYPVIVLLYNILQ